MLPFMKMCFFYKWARLTRSFSVDPNPLKIRSSVGPAEQRCFSKTFYNLTESLPDQTMRRLKTENWKGSGVSAEWWRGASLRRSGWAAGCLQPVSSTRLSCSSTNMTIISHYFHFSLYQLRFEIVRVSRAGLPAGGAVPHTCVLDLSFLSHLFCCFYLFMFLECVILWHFDVGIN